MCITLHLPSIQTNSLSLDLDMSVVDGEDQVVMDGTLDSTFSDSIQTTTTNSVAAESGK